MSAQSDTVLSLDTGTAAPLVPTPRRIIGTNDLLPVNFLARGARAARTIARIVIPVSGKPGYVGYGTGFLIGADLMLTNNHVLSDPAVAETATAEFFYELDTDGRPAHVIKVKAAPRTVFLTHKPLDYTIVALEPLEGGRLPGDEFGVNRLNCEPGQGSLGQPVNVIGHPAGRRKEAAIRNNLITELLTDRIHYGTDTEPGNSGSPVYDDQWQVLALHRAAVTGANEGVRISSICAHVRDQDLTRQAADRLRDAGIL
ncbi:serine protease [Streptomyces sp. UH6]|uniref:trypsin-like serine peptidase n=1 Tax=Streptomyces sp. UH6 TaxID=2748379 RepID=UPI0015D48421|nr:serine protease [Streptomyces sp. UH6]NYV72833.1 trypsin-like peptidase domain-containing protein [Streptomyces sp. UH6]